MVDEREMIGASPLRKTIGWGRSLKWANWVPVNYFVIRWLDSGFEGKNVTTEVRVLEVPYEGQL